MKTYAKAVIEIKSDDHDTKLTLSSINQKPAISLGHSPGQDIHDFFVNNLLNTDSSSKWVDTKHKMTNLSKSAIAYVTGTCAMIIVLASAIAAIWFAALNGWATVTNLASSTLSGIGIAIGGCLGSALILRFKAARYYVRTVIKDLVQ